MSDPAPILHYTFSGKPFILNYMFGEGNMSCSDFADPDQSGIGVVVAGVSVALVTAIASWVALVLEKKSLSDKQKVCQEVIERAIFSFADQQLITGIALLASAYVNIHEYTLYQEDRWDFQDAHFTLVVYQSCLSISSCLGCLTTLRKPQHLAITCIRLFIITIFALSLIVTIASSDQAFLPIFYVLQGMPGPDNNVLFTNFSMNLRRGLSVLAVTLTYCFSLMHALNNEDMKQLWAHMEQKLPLFLDRRHIKRLKDPIEQTLQRICSCHQWIGYAFRLFCSKEWALFLYSAYTVLFVLLVSFQKWDKPPEPPSEVAQDLGIREWCGLNNGGENRWTFGQTVAVTMLLLPILSVLYTYFEVKKFESDMANVKAEKDSLNRQLLGEKERFQRETEKRVGEKRNFEERLQQLEIEKRNLSERLENVISIV